MPGELPFLSDP
jgi:hypothetical protein